MLNVRLRDGLSLAGPVSNDLRERVAAVALGASKGLESSEHLASKCTVRTHGLTWDKLPHSEPPASGVTVPIKACSSS